MYRTVHNACLDYGRRELRHGRRSAGSLDERFDAGGEAGPYDAALAAYAAERGAAEEDAVAAEASRQEAEGLVAWAIGQVRNESHRAVLELTWLQKLDGPAIARRLGITMDNLYQRRSRGQREMERILRAREP